MILPRATMPSSKARVLLIRKSCGRPILSFSLFFDENSEDLADRDGLGKRVVRGSIASAGARGRRPPF